VPEVTTADSERALSALGICFEEYQYPYPVRFMTVQNDLQTLAMAYMDVPPASVGNGETVVLMHGKAFGGYYFEQVIEALSESGYRVVVPDQIGWGKSSKPDIHYSFHLLAANTASLLDQLGVGKVAVLGHSTGGMTATRFTLMNPDRVTHLVLEDPLGLADYRIGIPPQSEQTLYDHELHWTDPTVIRGYVAGYFVHPDPKVYEPLAEVLIRVTLSPDYPRWARAAALTFQMIYQQPVCYEYHRIAPPTLLIVGAEDHVVPLGNYAPPDEAARLGDFIALSEAAARDIPNATRVVIPECGHIPHIEHPSQFLDAFVPFLAT
jgi:pimeloyl-ACP methyl ester carboxylesterase